ncbi:coiled-coil domain-containing protein 187 isoform X4 [Denticeps clupeoides]|uniref:Coiled-coil domain-containing protein n=1 Tax=Denticeps clupeoides TaxID=299321 RepID=A0AAY4EBY8_9TELE|nr:coiled-coil domain-containing protein 50-like isoform X4 [Denticeps clupeoides]
MTERDVDQSNLPGVEEVCQSFAVLEDGVLAHNLQEQEIEQHYSLNVQKNHLVQNDLRIARRLQDEEQTRLSNASHQREVQDSEFARRIQEDIERRAEEEARKREQEDEEIARRIQEEEVLRVGHRSGIRASIHGGRTGDLRVGAVSLDLGELRQVLQDEELARRLQEEEESLIRRNLRSSVLERPYPDGDFQVAQVAQDEEIARFIQKQDMKSERVWHDGETSEPRSGRGNAEMNDKCNQNPACGRQRERLNSEGLLSPSDSHSPELQARQNSRPVSMTSSPQSSRNIAEELDPTFQAKRSDTARLEQQSSGLSQSPPHSRFSSRDAARESVFVLPTKRQSEKLGQVKAKDKDGGKQNCKQQ